MMAEHWTSPAGQDKSKAENERVTTLFSIVAIESPCSIVTTNTTMSMALESTPTMGSSITIAFDILFLKPLQIQQSTQTAALGKDLHGRVRRHVNFRLKNTTSAHTELSCTTIRVASTSK